MKFLQLWQMSTDQPSNISAPFRVDLTAVHLHRVLDHHAEALLAQSYMQRDLAVVQAMLQDKIGGCLSRPWRR